MDVEQHIATLYERAKAIIKKDTSMAYCNEKEQLFLEMDVLGVDLSASLLHMRDKMQFSKNEIANNASL